MLTDTKAVIRAIKTRITSTMLRHQVQKRAGTGNGSYLRNEIHSPLFSVRGEKEVKARSDPQRAVKFSLTEQDGKFVVVKTITMCLSLAFCLILSWGNNNNVLGLWSRRGLLAYVYSGVSNKECIRMNALVAGTALI